MATPGNFTTLAASGTVTFGLGATSGYYWTCSNSSGDGLWAALPSVGNYSSINLTAGATIGKVWQCTNTVTGAGAWVSIASLSTGGALTVSNDTNITATLSGSNTTALFTPVTINLAWLGTLAPGRGGTGYDGTGMTLGDLLYASISSTMTRLPGNTTSTRKFLMSVGSGAAATAPFWDVIQGSDIGNIITQFTSAGFGIPAQNNSHIATSNRTGVAGVNYQIALGGVYTAINTTTEIKDLDITTTHVSSSAGLTSSECICIENTINATLGTIDEHCGIHIHPGINIGGTVTSAYGAHITTPGYGTNRYALWTEDITVGDATPYSLLAVDANNKVTSIAPYADGFATYVLTWTSGTTAPTWQVPTGGGGGGSGITSGTGTANQILLNGTTATQFSASTFSLSPTLIAPGSIRTTTTMAIVSAIDSTIGLLNGFTFTGAANNYQAYNSTGTISFTSGSTTNTSAFSISNIINTNGATITTGAGINNSPTLRNMSGTFTNAYTYYSNPTVTGTTNIGTYASIYCATPTSTGTITTAYTAYFEAPPATASTGVAVWTDSLQVGGTANGVAAAGSVKLGSASINATSLLATDSNKIITTTTSTITPTFAGLVLGTITGLLKATSGTISQATAGTDYEAPITGGTTLQYLRGDKSLSTFSTDVRAQISASGNLSYTTGNVTLNTTITGLTSVAATTFTGALTGNASTATALSTSGAANQFWKNGNVWGQPAQADISGLTTASSPTFTGITLSGATGDTLTYFNTSKALTSVTLDSNLTLTTGTLALNTTVSGLTSISATTFTGALTGNASTATALSTSGTANQFWKNGNVWGQPTQADISGLTTSSSPSFTGLTISGLASGDVLAYFNTSKALTAVTLNSNLTLTTGTLALNTTITGLTSISATTFTGALTGNASTATALSTSGTTNQFWKNGNTWAQPTQADISGLTTSSSPSFTGLTVSGLATGDVLAYFNTSKALSAVTLSSNLTLTTGTLALNTTITGLTSVSSTTFVGALTGNASTATALSTAGSANQFWKNGNVWAQPAQADINGLTTASSPSFTGVTVSGSTGDTLTYFNTSKGLASVTLSSNLTLTTGTLDTVQGIQTTSNPQFNSLGIGTAASGTAGYARINNVLGVGIAPAANNILMVGGSATATAVSFTANSIGASVTGQASAISPTLYGSNYTGTYTFGATSTATGTLTSINVNQTQNSVSGPTTVNMYGININNTQATVSGPTTTSAYGLSVTPNTTAATGTLAFYASVFSAAGTMTGTITAAYGGYFNTPAGGSAKTALYAADCAIGTTATTPPTNGLLVAGPIKNTNISANTLTYADASQQLASVTLNSNITLTTGTLALNTTISGLTSVSSTSFTGALTGNASTATALSTSGTTNQFWKNGNVWGQPTQADISGLTTSSSPSFTGVTISGATGDTLTYFNTSKALTSVTLNSNLTLTTGTLALNTTITGLTSVSSTTFVGALTGNSSTATALSTAGTTNQFWKNGNVWGQPTQADISGLTTSSSPSFTGVTISGATGDTLTYFNTSKALTSVTLNSNLTLTTGTLALNTTISGLTSVSSTSFTGALTGNASTATALSTSGSANQFWKNGNTWAQPTQADISGLTTSSSPSFTGLNLSGATSYAPLIVDNLKNVVSVTTGMSNAGYILTSNGSGAAPTWQANAGGGGGGGVPSVTGTTNQILINGATSTVTSAATFTIDTTFVAPGSISSTTTIGIVSAASANTGLINGFTYSGVGGTNKTIETLNGSLSFSSTTTSLAAGLSITSAIGTTSNAVLTAAAGISNQPSFTANSSVNTSTFYGIYNNSTFTNTQASSAFYATYNNCSITLTANLSDYYGEYVGCSISSGTGTLSNMYGIYVDVLTKATGTVTIAYGSYTKVPTAGTTNIATYTDNLAIGTTGTAPPNNGLLVSGVIKNTNLSINTLTYADGSSQLASVTLNSNLTLTTGTLAFNTTISGLTSVSSTTFVGALTGNASTATALSTAGSANQFWKNGNVWAQPAQADISGLTTSSSPSFTGVTVSGSTGDTLTYFNTSKALTSVTLNSNLTLTTGTLALNTTISGLTSVSSTTFVGALTGNASTATALSTAGTTNQFWKNGNTWAQPTQADISGLTTSSSPSFTGVTVSGSTGDTLTYFNTSKSLTSVTLNSNLTLTTGTLALNTTISGLTSVSSTTFVGALTGNSSTATALSTAGTTNQFWKNGNVWAQPTQADISGLTTSSSPSFTGVTVSGSTGDTLTYFNTSKGLTSVTLSSNLTLTTGTLDTVQGIQTTSNPQFNSLGIGTTASGTAGYARINARLGVAMAPSYPLDITGQSRLSSSLSINNATPNTYTALDINTGFTATGASSNNYGLNMSGTFIGTVFTGTSNIYGVNVSSTLKLPSSATSECASIKITPQFDANTFTIATAYGLYVATGTNASGTVTVAYGSYVKVPTAGSTNIASYTDNLAIGTTGTAPPANGLLVAGSIKNTNLSTGVLVYSDASTQLASVTLNSNLTLTTGTLALNTTISGLTSVSSTSFTGALTGNASTATALSTAGSANQFWKNGNVWAQPTQADISGLTTGSSPSFTGLTISGITGDTLTYFNTSKALASVTLNSNLTLTTGTLALNTTISGLTSVSATTFTGALTGNASTATALSTAGSANQFWKNGNTWAQPTQADISGLTTSSSPSFTGVTVSGSTGDTLTYFNTSKALTSVTLNSNLTLTTGTLALNTTISGLTSVSSTGFTGALTGNASTATALSTAGSANQFWKNGNVWAQPTQADISGLTTSSSPTFVGLTLTGFVSNLLWCNGSSVLSTVILSSNFAPGFVGTLDLIQDIQTTSTPRFAGLALGAAYNSLYGLYNNFSNASTTTSNYAGYYSNGTFTLATGVTNALLSGMNVSNTFTTNNAGATLQIAANIYSNPSFTNTSATSYAKGASIYLAQPTISGTVAAAYGIYNNSPVGATLNYGYLQTGTFTKTTDVGMYLNNTFTPAANSGTLYQLYLAPTFNSATNTITDAYCASFTPTFSVSSAVTNVYGLNVSITDTINSASILQNSYGIKVGTVANGSSSTAINNAYNLYLNGMTVSGSATITNGYGIYNSVPTGAGTNIGHRQAGTFTKGFDMGLYISDTFTPTGGATSIYDLYLETTVNTTSGAIGTATAERIAATFSTTSTSAFTTIYGSNMSVSNTFSAVATTTDSITLNISNAASGASAGIVTNMYGIKVNALTKSGSATVTNAYGGYFTAPTAGGTKNIALFADDISLGSSVTASTVMYLDANKKINSVAANGNTAYVLTNTSPPTWAAAPGGGSGVPSVTGTTNQILINGGTSAVTTAATFTIPSTFVAPGTIQATSTMGVGTAPSTDFGIKTDFTYTGAIPLYIGGNYIGGTMTFNSGTPDTVAGLYNEPTFDFQTGVSTSYNTTGIYNAPWFKSNSSVGSNAWSGIYNAPYLTNNTQSDYYCGLYNWTKAVVVADLTTFCGVDLSTVVSPGSSGTVTDMYGLRVNITVKSAGTVTTAYGAYINNPTAGTSNIALFAANANLNYAGVAPPSGGMIMSGKLGVGNNNPTNQLEVTGTARFSSSVICATGALTTSATDGFIYIPTCAGIPTGVPTSQTGTCAMAYDTTNNDLYIYDGAWQKSTLNAASSSDTFETINNNNNCYPYSLTYDGSNRYSTITYTAPGGSIVKTFSYNGDGTINTIVLSGAGLPTITYTTKTYTYTSGSLTSVAYS